MEKKNSAAGSPHEVASPVIEEEFAASLGCGQEDVYSLIVHGEDISHVDHFEGLAEELGLESI